MGPRVQQFVKYWVFLAAKLAAGTLLLAGCLWVLNLFWAPSPPFLHIASWRFGYDLAYTTAVGFWFLLASGVLYLCVWDQRYRCRVCLRRLRMPVETGSWSLMLQFGRPQMEYICPYGHGKLNVAELQILGRENPKWKEHGDMWEELCASAKGPEDRP